MKADDVAVINGVLDAIHEWRYGPGAEMDRNGNLKDAVKLYETAGSPRVPDLPEWRCSTCLSHIPCHTPGERDCLDDRAYKGGCVTPDFRFYKPAFPVDLPTAEQLEEAIELLNHHIHGYRTQHPVADWLRALKGEP